MLSNATSKKMVTELTQRNAERRLAAAPESEPAATLPAGRNRHRAHSAPHRALSRRCHGERAGDNSPSRRRSSPSSRSAPLSYGARASSAAILAHSDSPVPAHSMSEEEVDEGDFLSVGKWQPGMYEPTEEEVDEGAFLSVGKWQPGMYEPPEPEEHRKVAARHVPADRGGRRRGLPKRWKVAAQHVRADREGGRRRGLSERLPERLPQR